MPVLVTGAEDALGRAVIDRLRASRGEVRAYLDATVVGGAEADALRAAGCKVAVGELDDEGHLESALAQVHTLAHCWGGPLRDPEALVTAAATAASAALGAGVRRLVWVRELGSGAGNEYLDALAEIADLVDALPMETVTLATGVRYGSSDALTRRLAGGWLDGQAVARGTAHAPTAIADVAHAIAVADRQRGSTGEVHVRMALVGPEQMTLDEFLRRLATVVPDGSGPPPPWLADWLSRPAVAPAPTSAGPPAVLARGTVRLDEPRG